MSDLREKWKNRRKNEETDMFFKSNCGICSLFFPLSYYPFQVL